MPAKPRLAFAYPVMTRGWAPIMEGRFLSQVNACYNG